MSCVLSVYGAAAYREILLPAMDNSDYDLNLSKELFGISEDAVLRMEVMEGEWSFVEDSSYSVLYSATGMCCEGKALQHNDLLSVHLHGTDQIFIIVKMTDASFIVYSKFDLSGINYITIGSDSNNVFQYSVRINQKSLISAEHARIQRVENGFILTDCSKNGSFINEKRVVGNVQKLQFGDLINIYGLKIIFLNNVLAVNTATEGLRIGTGVLMPYRPVEAQRPGEKIPVPDKDRLFRRSPRNIPKIEAEPVEIEAPPAPRENITQPGLMAIGPSLTMALPMLLGTGVSIAASMASTGHFQVLMISGIITAVGSSIVGTFWALKNMKAQKKKNREEEVRRFETYSQYLIRCANDIKDKYENNTKALYQMYRSSDECSFIGRENIELWNRNSRHEDFLRHRLGIGEIPFQVEINVPKERFSVLSDNLGERPRMIKESYKMLKDVPVCVDLYKNKLIGLIGGEGYRGCYQIMHDLVAQIVSSDCYTDVKLAFVFDGNGNINEANWGFAKWLPHVWSEDGKVRYVAMDRNDASDVFYELTNILRFRAEEKQNSISSNKQVIEKPYYILFLENPELLEGELLAKYVYNSEANYGMTTVLLVHSYDELPNACEYIIENTERYRGAYYVTDGEDERIPVNYDMVVGNHLERMARRLSDVKVKEETSGGEIPSGITFFDMYGISHLEELQVLDRWKKNRTYDSLRALIGQKSGGADCYLDVHEKYHGPHGLVAGTTGSGKSETLQTYMLSLAINYSPDDIGFFIIDYKGGGMANLFNGLPHMIGQISNLSGNQVHRAMVSIKSENMRRQRIFNEHGVNNINLYTRLYKNNEAKLPVPHMFIIIDEFAELKREEPEFMKELISVAQVGRSLGVHLILATQKPAGTVDDNIWSNSKFRLCLRVQDRQDSMDMLHKPDAAYITQAGRGYMQVGNDELYELFQSGYSGAVYDENGGVQADIARMLGDNGKAALVGSHAQLQRKEKIRNAWISRLIDVADNAARRIECNIEDCLEDKSLENNLIKEFFKEIERQGIEYQDNDHNQHAVQDFLDVYASCLKRSAYEDEVNMPEMINILAGNMRKKLPEAEEKTQLDAVVGYLAEIAEKNGYNRNLQLWLPVLPEMIYLDELKGYRSRTFDGNEWHQPGKRFTLETLIGLYDDPENQAQNPVAVDIAECGNMAVVGMPMTGKSTFLLSYLYSVAECYSPEVVNFYILDFSSKLLGALAGLPHTGGMMFEEDNEKVEKFFTFLVRMLQERKHLLQGGSFKQYVQASGYSIPAVIVAIDNYASFRVKTENRYDDLMLSLMKEANNYGIYFALSAGGYSSGEIPIKVSELIRTSFALELNERFAYGEVMHTMHLEVLPETNIKGRGLVKIGESILEFQTAMSIEAADDFERSEKLKELARQLSQAWKGKKAREIPTIPDEPIWGEFCELDDVIRMAAEKEYLPVGYDQRTAAIYGISLRNTYTYIISGKAHTGKTNMMKIICSSAYMAGIRLSVIDFKGEFRALASVLGADYINNDSEMYSFFEALIPDFKQRNALKKECADKGFTDKELYDKMQVFPKRFIVIGNLVDFAKHVNKPEEGVLDMSGLLCNLLDRGAMHNIYWFADLNQDQVPEVMTINVFQVFIRERNGMHFGGNVQAQKLLAFDHVKYNEQARKYPPGFGMLPTHDGDDTKMVVTPFYRINQQGGDA
ncbi:MAG: type VII secretion protein EssC [Lachnospiraceae bacterium]|nr:type VII secretion protein EssC [Lachnospiraceae bacterium]